MAFRDIYTGGKSNLIPKVHVIQEKINQVLKEMQIL
jgi:hypothetical protein